jgi:hypothetical protein
MALITIKSKCKLLVLSWKINLMYFPYYIKYKNQIQN